jgi:ABC-type multidrug transport system ATPase subunit
MLAFRDLILNGKLHSNIFAIDEMLDMNVDSICIENVMKILKRKSIESNQNIFIISHRSELAEDETIWNNIIKITKEHGCSTYSVK